MANSEDSPHVEVIKELEDEKKRLQAEVVRLVKEKKEVQDRLEFVEELVGPTEAQRKTFQDQITAARSAAIQAHRNGAAVPIHFAGRLDESWLHTRGLSERDCALLQRGCITGQDGVPRDVSMLGDPSFRPYHGESHEPLWEARGGALRLSLSDVRMRWGEEVALDLVRCAIELDKHDASRRLGVELPWNEIQERELEPAEVIALLERELFTTRCYSSGGGSTGAMPSEALSSEVSSMGVLEQEPGRSNSPTWSIFESEDMCDSGFDASSATLSLSSPVGEQAGILEHRGSSDYLDDWSLADADLEQLLWPPRARPKVAEAPATPRGEQNADVDLSEDTLRFSDEVDDLGEVLREFLEEEVGGSLGGLFVPLQPPY